MLVACLAVSIVGITTDDIVTPDRNVDDRYWRTGNAVACMWTMMVVSFGIAVELILGPFNCLNLRYHDGNCLVIFRFVVRVICGYLTVHHCVIILLEHYSVHSTGYCSSDSISFPFCSIA